MKIKKLALEKEQLRKELVHLQLCLSQQEVGLGDWRESMERAERRQAEKKQHMRDKFYSYRCYTWFSAYTYTCSYMLANPCNDVV